MSDEPTKADDEPTTADDAALREAQRQERIRRGHETESGLGILRAVGFTQGLSAPDDETALMLRQIARWRGAY